MDEKTNLSEQEISVIKAAFSNNEELLKAMRALFLDIDVSETDKSLVSSAFAGNDALRTAVSRRLMPTLDKTMPIGQVQDIWLGSEQMIYGQSLDTIKQTLKYKSLVKKYTEKSIALLSNVEAERVSMKLDNLDSQDEYASELLARNQFIRHIESQLLYLSVIAKTDEKSDEQKKKDRLLDSTK